MCGLSGFIDLSTGTGPAAPSDDVRARLTRMTDCIAYRGPDSAGYQVEQAGAHMVAFGHRRLAIVDLSPGGAQPMESHSGRYLLVYNGEIYNFLEIRTALEERGVRFKSSSDTEVMLAAFEAWGVADSLKKFAGMFACALFDRQTRMLHLFRDRLGKKPLYIGYVGNQFAFSSALKSFTTLPGFTREQDHEALHLFIRHNFIPAPWSIYKGIFKLPQAQLLSLSLDELAATRNAADLLPRAQPYWDLQAQAAQTPRNISENDALHELEELLGLATRQRMISDVPLGAFLSGGIDSSLVVALMQKHASQPVRTYSIGFAEASHNEGAYARAVAQHLGTAHTEFTVTADEARAVIPQLPDIYDEPFADSSQIPTWHVCRLARQEVTVALSGDGGDEAFAGYNRYLLARYVFPALQVIPEPLRQLMGSIKGRVGHQNARRFLEICAASDSDAFYRRILSYWQDTREVIHGGQSPDFLLPPPSKNIVRYMMMGDAMGYLPDDILAKVDRASMAVSLETRAPLLDHRVFEYAWSLPDDLKVRHGKGKYILRQLLARHVPTALFERPKQGFGIPLGAWLRGPLAPWMQDMLSEERLRAQGLFKPEAITPLVQAHISGSHDWSYRLWGLLMYQAWHERWQS